MSWYVTREGDVIEWKPNAASYAAGPFSSPSDALRWSHRRDSRSLLVRAILCGLGVLMISYGLL